MPSHAARDVVEALSGPEAADDVCMCGQNEPCQNDRATSMFESAVESRATTKSVGGVSDEGLLDSGRDGSR
jgi:hypothetical protein